MVSTFLVCGWFTPLRYFPRFPLREFRGVGGGEVCEEFSEPAWILGCAAYAGGVEAGGEVMCLLEGVRREVCFGDGSEVVVFLHTVPLATFCFCGGAEVGVFGGSWEIHFQD